MPSKRPERRTPPNLLLWAYALTVGLFLIGSQIPAFRVWGIAHWAYFPFWLQIILTALALAAIPLSLRLSDNRETPDQPARGSWPVIAAVIGVAFLALIYSLPQKAHFLGDGYTVLKWLETDNPMLKIRNFGSLHTHRLFYSSFEGTNSALVTFRTEGYISALITLITLGVIVPKLMAGVLHRSLATLAILTGGYALLYFGYVENYTFFVTWVLLFALMGLLVARERLHPAWLMIPLTLSVIFHIFGVALIPAALYLMFRRTAPGRKLRDLTPGHRRLLLAIVIALPIAVFLWFYNTSYFFRFAFVPLLPNRFTVNGYTLLSPKHIADMLNLLLILTPGLLIALAGLHRAGWRRPWRQPVYRFLLLLAICTIGIAFLFDPKLGMPRDWDLFAFCGIPVTLLAVYLFCDADLLRRGRTAGLLLLVALGLLALIPRAVRQHTPEMALAQFRNYEALDPIKNRNGGIYVVDYYRRLGDSTKAEQVRDQWHADRREEQLVLQANQLLEAGKYGRAALLLRQAIDINPMYSTAYTNLAEAYLRSGFTDSAIATLNIARGLNPYNPVILHNIGYLRLKQGDLDQAEALIREAAHLDPTYAVALSTLANIYRQQKDRDKYIATLERLAQTDNPPPKDLASLANWRAANNRHSEAADILNRAIELGLDTTIVKTLLEKYPQLEEELDS